MSKAKKITIIIVSAFIALVLLMYLTVCLFSEKPGMNGFAVTNGTINMYLSGKDYVKVGENRYIYRKGALKQIIENEYDSCVYIKKLVEHGHYPDEPPNLDELTESEILKYTLTIKDGKELKGGGVTVWGGLADALNIRPNSVYYYPYESK